MGCVLCHCKRQVGLGQIRSWKGNVQGQASVPKGGHRGWPLGGEDLSLALGVAFLAGGWSVVVRVFAKRPVLQSET